MSVSCKHSDDIMTSSMSTAEQVQEGDFLEVVTAAPRVVCHFFHREFERCKIIDKHLTVLARKYFDTRFIKLSAPVRSYLYLHACLLPSLQKSANSCMCDCDRSLYWLHASEPCQKMTYCIPIPCIIIPALMYVKAAQISTLQMHLSCQQPRPVGLA